MMSSFRLSIAPLASALALVLYGSIGAAGAQALETAPGNPVPGPVPEERAASDDASESATEPPIVRFDMSALRMRGYTADVADFFAREARFLPGTHLVSISLNGARPQKLEVRFDDQGQLCFAPALLAALVLRAPETAAADTECSDFLVAFPESTVKLRPGQGRVDLVVPERALDAARRGDGYLRSGTAAILNYDVFAQRSDNRFSSSSLVYGRLEPGLNLGNWVLRSRESYFHSPDRNEFIHQEAYAGRTVESLKAMLRIGQLQTANQAFAGLPMTGAQLFSDGSQLSSTQLVAPIQGVARTQALIEVRQRGQLIYKTLVAPGPFSLENVGQLSAGVDVEVTVVEEDGSRQHFVVAGSSGFNDPNQENTFSLGAGVYRDLGNLDPGVKKPLLLSGEYAYSPLDTLRLSHSALLSPHYRSSVTQMSFAPSADIWINAAWRLSDSVQGFGNEFDLNGSWRISDHWSTSLSTLKRGRKYLTLDQAFRLERDEGIPVDPEIPETSIFNDIESSYGATLSYSHRDYGNFSYSHYRSQLFDGAALANQSFNYGHRFRKANVNLGWQRSRGGATNNDTVFLNLSVPLGRGNARLRGYERNGSRSYNARYDAKAGANISYSLGTSVSDGGDQRLDGSMTMNTSYAQLGGGASVSNYGFRSVHASASGALLAGHGTVATSSQRIGDTFGIIQVPGVPGLRFSTPGGTVITDSRGTAVVPMLRPYANNRIEVQGLSVPKNYQLQTSVTELAPAHGSVAFTDIAATEIRQLLLNITLADGSPASYGASIRDSEGNLITTVVGNGNAILVNADIGKELSLVTSSNRRCSVQYDVPKKFDPEQPYEQADARCDFE